jgi:hypothetical protein
MTGQAAKLQQIDFYRNSYSGVLLAWYSGLSARAEHTP